MNFENLGTILGGGCGTTDMTKKSAHIQEAYKLGKSIQ